jgi:hypothetical protein
VLGYVFVHHLDVWKGAAKKMEQVYSSTPLNAGNVFKSFMLIDTTEILPEQVLRTIQNTFMSALSNTTLKRFIQENDNMFECCKYFFIPARLNVETIPLPIKESSLRNWILIIMTIPFSRIYCDKYHSIINNLQFLYNNYDALEQPTTVSKFTTSLEFEWIKNSVMMEAYTKEHATQVFIRVFMQISLLASIEILKVYNPAIAEANYYNSNYDGAWLIAVDPIHMEHLDKLHLLFKYVNTSKFNQK